MRVGREHWGSLNSEDVAWVLEWQLAQRLAGFAPGEVPPVHAEPVPDPRDPVWCVSVTLTGLSAPVRLPLRDLAKVILWCHGARTVSALQHPPRWVRPSLYVLRRRVSRTVTVLDPLLRMGYRDRLPGDRR